MTVGDRIKELRVACGLAQEELAECANTTKQTIHKYEMGIVQNIPSSKIEAIARRLDVTPAYLFGWENCIASDIHNSAIVQGSNATTIIARNGMVGRDLDEQEAELLRILAILDVKGRTALMAYAFELEDKMKIKE